MMQMDEPGLGRGDKGVLTVWGITPLFDVPQLTPVFQLSLLFQVSHILYSW